MGILSRLVSMFARLKRRRIVRQRLEQVIACERARVAA